MEFISDEVKRLTGYPPNDSLQNAVRSWASIIHSEGKETVEEYAVEKINRKEPYTIEYRIIGADGGIRWCYEKGQGVFDEQGKLCFLDGVVVDRTEHKQAEEALWESEMCYKSLVELSPEAVFVHHEGMFVYINPAGTRILGATGHEEIIGKPVLDVIHPDYLEIVKLRMEQCYRERTTMLPAELKYIRFDKKVIDVIATGNYINYLGKPSILSVIRDITDQKLAEGALRESEGRYRELVENAVLGIFQVTKGGKFLMANQRMANIFGYDSQQDFFGDVGNIIKLHVNPEERAKILQEIDEKGHIEGKEMNFKGRNGNPLFCNAYVRLIQNEDGRYIYEGLLEDITDKKKIAEEFLKAKKLESVGVLAGGIAHDFNNLMSAVVGNISLARMGMKPGSKGFKNLLEAEKASIQTKELTARLITFSKGGGPIKDIVPIGNLLKDSAESSLKGSDIDARFSIPDDISPVEVDEDQMKQVIHNLITNAQETMGEQGAINVSCENVNIGEKDALTLKDGRYVRISIKDQGAGIPDEDLGRIFDPYFSTKDMGTQNGMGLGLAVSDSIVKQHDGLITVESELGTGTTFSIYLPASSAERQAPSAKPVVEVQSAILYQQSSIQRVLVMDDEEVVRDVSNALLTHLGYEVVVAVDGVEAIGLYKKAMESEKPFDMAILDLTNKVGMGGAETMVNLLEIDPDIKAIVASGYSNDPVINNSREHGFRGALPKPFTLDQLKTALQDAIAGE